MRTIKPVLGAFAGIACLAIWTTVSVSDFLAADETKPVRTAETETTNVEALINNLAKQAPARTESELLDGVSAEVTRLSDAYNSGTLSCEDCLEKVDMKLAMLKEIAPAAQIEPVHTELIELRNELPCCGAEEVIVEEEIISEGPCPAPIAPAPMAPMMPEPAVVMGGGGGGGGGINFLPLAGLGAGAALLLNDDDDNRPRRPATPTR